ATFRRAFVAELRQQRKFALRLGHVARDRDWSLSPRLTRHTLKLGRWLERFNAMAEQTAIASPLTEEMRCELREALAIQGSRRARDALGMPREIRGAPTASAV